MAIARVAIDVPVETLFDYRHGNSALVPGQLVVVPFGRRRQVGVVVEIVDRSEIAKARLRSIERLLSVDPLPQDLLAMIRFCSAYYHHPFGQALLSALPASFRRVNYEGPKSDWQYALTSEGRTLRPDVFPRAAALKRRLLAALLTAGGLGQAQARALSLRAPAVLKQWINAGWVEKHAVSSAVPVVPASRPQVAPHLTGEQLSAVEQVSANFGAFSPWLLHGVTGSGKTEVYFRLIEAAVARGLQSLLLVPEINLTPQLEARFLQRFPGVNLVSVHSGLSDGERGERWLEAFAGKAQVVLGTRLAVFVPLPRLGLIIVDEEHDASFKQQEGLRYSARDLAVFVAQQRRVPIVLGSATPALESYHNARNGRFGHLRLSVRPAANAPQVRLLETRVARQTHGMSEPLLQAMRERLARGEQTLVFLNRRGFAPALVCGACGWVAQCSRCAARLVWHLRAARLRCHYCGHEEPLPTACPECGNQDLKGLGQGTQRLEQALAGIFPAARILRIDRDSTRRKQSWQAMRTDIQEERVDILVGTQMLAKGHDFPKLTLVAVVNPDNALFSADFRAAEKLFQQLMQVTGRTGRAGLPGEALVQTQFPAHPLYQALLRQDYTAFAEELLAERKLSGFPPFVYQALLRAEALSAQAAMDFLTQAARHAPRHDKTVTLYDPVPAAIARIAGHYRAHLLVQAPSRIALQRLLSAWVPAITQRKAGRVRWSLDVDPLEL